MDSLIRSMFIVFVDIVFGFLVPLRAAASPFRGHKGLEGFSIGFLHLYSVSAIDSVAAVNPGLV